jgi:aspartate racemase
MKTIGIIGGMSWESTQLYYRIINEAVKTRLGGLHSAKLLLYSFDFEEIASRQKSGDWDTLTDKLIGVAQTLEKAGAEAIVIATNTMHKMAPQIQSAISIPLLHIIDVVADAIKAQGIHTIALLGTRYTMEGGFYAQRLQDNGLTVLIPSALQRDLINCVIYDELILGVVRDASRDDYVAIIQDLARQGAQGVILGCTEIVMLISSHDSPIPTFDTTQIHALSTVNWMLQV